MEQIVDVTSLIESKQLQISGFGPAIMDWYENGGRSYTPEELEAWETVHDEWKHVKGGQWVRHCIHGHEKGEECDCKPLPPEPKQVDYLPHNRTP